MAERWFFTHVGLTCGPVSAGDLDTLLRGRKLLPHEMVWPEGFDVQIAVETYSTLQRTGSLPNWLNDVRLAESRKRAAAAKQLREPAGPPAFTPSITTGGARPDWLDDVRKLESTPAQPKRPVPPQPPAQPPPPSIKTPAPGRPGTPPTQQPLISSRKVPPSPAALALPPDWLDDIREIEESLRRSPARPTPPVSNRTPVPGPAPTVPSRPTPPATKPPAAPPPPRAAVLPVATPPTPAAPPRVVTPPASPPVAPPAKTSPAALPPAPPAPATLAAQVPAPAPVQTPPIAPVTPAPAAEVPPSVPQTEPRRAGAYDPQLHAGLSVFEVFLYARKAIQDWVDDDTNKPLVAAGNIQAVRNDRQVQYLVNSYQGYSKVMVEKLWKHLEFLVDNRRQFYAAFGLSS